MSYRLLQVLAVVLPTLLIGGFEYIRHEFLLEYLSMETGNLYITILTFILSLLFSVWMFRIIRATNERLAQEQAKRAVYEERERLASELHDGIAQTLFFLNIKLKQGHIDEAMHAVSMIDNHVRQAIFNLRSLPEEGDVLTSRLAKWLSEWSALTGIDVKEDIELPHKLFTPKEEIQLFAIIQEAFANIRKHSGASHVIIEFKGGDGGWQLKIIDDGCGFDSAAISVKNYGVFMMKERAEQLGASFRLFKRETRGTELIVTKEK
ncbi:histidine kinase [Aneurinibacillus thermoaerophilus]|uniref:histidine kinase n=1 Tax=Aneurinibacillus thermoaerophilus TaxID=143495 RepID=A0A1G7XZ00_ANETH|nr:histidine kinase [Aneurinibacillus thermoaerophilus]MED0675972.1 histidine kinase [Aneurinibacillus thermoaerophilus]MED0677752.1 histidine kinase [Aneurinibacillus thermoaerophilus]MED0758073.1 histidine kinase [Aneurinibacillus thermoaerophilus]MED0761227.1 histidine kinase [Aneurinibacillus thermoaerophilus]MED0762828.1 histidine kinase [Aneurinibacillus thermoaerophilus]